MNRHSHGEPTSHRMDPKAEAALITKRAVRHLMHYSHSNDLLLSTMRRSTEAPGDFPNQEVFEAGAAAGGCRIDMRVFAADGQFDHRMYLVRQMSATEEERLAIGANRLDPL